MSLTLSEISQISKEESPVFIMGVPRSGTTLLYTMLLKHSSFKVSAEKPPKFGIAVESGVFMNPQKIHSSISANHYFLKNKEVFGEFLESIESIKKYQKIGNFLYNRRRLRTRINPSLKAIIYRLGLNHLVLRSYFYHAKIARKVTRILEKTPRHIEKASEVQITFPKAKIIFIYRHPLDVLSSFRKRLEIGKKEKPDSEIPGFWGMSTQDFCKLYQRCIDLAWRENRNNPENFRIIKYEELTANPEHTLQKICEFLEEKFEENMIPTGAAPNKAKYSPFLGGKVVQKTKEWGEFLDEDEAQLVESILSKLMQKLNYPQYTNVTTN